MTEPSDPRAQGRRRLLKALVATGGAFAGASALPSRWTRPVVDSLVIPLHAQTSPLPLVVGIFSTSAPALAGPVRAISSGLVVVGNGTFNLTWTLDPSGYVICGEGGVQAGSTFWEVIVSGSGGRSGDLLDDYAQSITGGTLQLTNQVASESAVTFTAGFQADTQAGLAVPGGSCNVNLTAMFRMSSPYSDTAV